MGFWRPQSADVDQASQNQAKCRRKTGQVQFTGRDNWTCPVFPFSSVIGLDADTMHTQKVFALAEALLRYRPDLSVTCCEYSVLDKRATALFDQPADLLVTCTDNLSSRVAVSLHAQCLLVPHLDIGTSVQRDNAGARRIFGDARLFLPNQACCFCTPALSAKNGTRSCTNWRRRRTA